MSQKKDIQRKDFLNTPPGAVSDKVVEFDIFDPETESKQPNMKPRRSIRNECPRIKGLQSKGNFFNKALHYKIHLPSIKIEIFRTYNDFEWLYKKLIDGHGHKQGSFVPALPDKISLKGINQSMITDHCKLMQEFICDVFKHSNLYNDQSTVYFLNPHKNKNFAKMRKSYIAQQIPLTDDDIKQIQNEDDSDDQMDNDNKNAKKTHISLNSENSNKHLQPL
eukprot:547761_1